MKITGNILMISRCARLYRNDRLKGYGICGMMDSVMLRICHSPGLSQDEIANRACIDKSNVARMVVKLTELGYITRTVSSEDRREKGVYPTEKGRELCEKIKEVAAECDEYMTGGLSDEQQQLLQSGLEAIYERAREYARKREVDGE